MTDAVKLRFVHADSGLAKPGSFLCRLVAKATGRPIEIISDMKVPVDLQFTSVQLPTRTRALREVRRVAARHSRGASRDGRWNTSNPAPVGEAGAHIWFTGENVRPPMNSWSGYLSFDLDPLGGRNVYLPLWWYSVGLLGEPVSPFTAHPPHWAELMSARDPGESRPNFACAFINNPDPMRLHAISELSKVGQVDVFGGAVGRPVPDKATVAKHYRFVVCFENDLYPGYVTEKAVEAWAAGAVPIWRGLDTAACFDPGSLLNAADFADFEVLAQEVAVINDDSNQWAHIASRALIRRQPDLAPALDLACVDESDGRLG